MVRLVSVPGAPRTHFTDRAMLIDALAARGFEQLAARLLAAAHAQDGDFGSRLAAAARSSVDFGAENPALVDLMFAAKTGEPSPGVASGADQLFGALKELTEEGVTLGAISPARAPRFPLLFAAFLRGVTGMVSSQLGDRRFGHELADDAMRALLSDAAAKTAD